MYWTQYSSFPRLWIVQWLLLMFFGIIGLRLFVIQIVETERYRSIAQKQYRSKVILPATRGTIVDRNGMTIAANAMHVSFAADPQLAVDDARAIAGRFSDLFGKPKRFYLDKLSSDSRFIWLERGVSATYRKSIMLSNLQGIVMRDEPKRLYYHDQIAGQLVGTTDTDNNGIAGVELAFDRELRGIDGYVIFQRDGLGRARPSVDYPRVDPVDGHNIVLTIDMRLQAIAERELKKGIEENSAEGGIVVILHPQSGDILSIAQYPDVNPAIYGKFNPQDQKLRAVTDLFEPGSVFKIVTASAALENSLVLPSKKFYAENGVYTLPGRTKPIVDTHKEGWITFQHAMEVSSNIVMAKVSDIVGSERFYRTARNYGFGIATNVDFPGEANGALKKPAQWSGTTLNTMAYGYEVGVTPMQLAAAYAAVANDGILMQPHLFKQELGVSGLPVRESHPQKIRRVISTETAHVLTSFLEGVVENGTGKPARISGTRVAGKTGTSKKYVEGRYEARSYIASFVGFFPVEDPKFVCLVMLDNPRGLNFTGGTTSAPVFRRIAEQVINTTDMLARIPNPIAEEKIDRPPTGGPVAPRSGDHPTSSLFSEARIVPNVQGYSVRRAINVLLDGKFEPVVSGSGTVISQEPAPGLRATLGIRVRLICQPKSSAALF